MSDLEKLRDLLAKATPGPFHVVGSAIWARDGYLAELSCPRGTERRFADAKMICAAINALPDLLTRLAALEAENAELREFLNFTGGTMDDALERAEAAEAALAKAKEDLRITQEVSNEIADALTVANGKLDAYRDAVRIDVQMEGPKFMGADLSALRRAWEKDRAIVEGSNDQKVTPSNSPK